MDLFLCLAIILLAGGALGFLLNRFKLPALLGYMVLGIVLGCFGLVNPQVLAISSELRKIALIIILLKAGLSLEAAALLHRDDRRGPCRTLISCWQSRPADILLPPSGGGVKHFRR